MSYYTQVEIGMIVDGEDETQYAPEPGDSVAQVLEAVKTYLEPSTIQRKMS